MLDIGFQEILILMVVALLVFGPDKLPELGRRLGRAMREFRRASDEFRSTIETNLHISSEESLLPPSATSLATPTSGDGASAAAVADVSTDGTAGARSDGGSPEGTAVAADGQAAAGEPAEPFWARRGGRILHRRSCSWRGRIPADEQIGLKAASDGRDMGLMPCPVCDPRETEAVV